LQAKATHCPVHATTARLLRHFGLEATVRPSLAFYNTRDEIARLAHAVARIART